MIRRRMVKKMSRTTFDKDKFDKREMKTKCIGCNNRYIKIGQFLEHG